jgi:hypothetical protein
VKVYISASWKQRERVRALAVSLRAVNHEVYDFTDPACRSAITGRACREIPPEQFPDLFDPAKHIYREYLTAVPQWRAAVDGNRQALRWCDAVVLLLPAGADSHADWALAVGMGKRSAVVGGPRAGERTPSHLWADALLDSDEEVPKWLNEFSRRITYRPVPGLGADGYFESVDEHGPYVIEWDGTGAWAVHANHRESVDIPRERLDRFVSAGDWTREESSDARQG